MNISGQGTTEKILVSLKSPIVVSIAFALWAIPIQYILQLWFYDHISKDYGTIQNFIEWFGVPYGFLIALVLVNVWTQFDALDLDFDREADDVYSLYGTALLVTADDAIASRDALLKKIRKYVQHVLKNYTSEWNTELVKKRSDGDRILSEIRNLVGKIIHSSEKEIVSDALLSLANDLIDIRGDRLARSKQRILPPVYTLSVVSSALWLIPFLALDFEDFFLGLILTGGVTFIVISVIRVIRDLDEPFDGAWYIKNESWVELAKKIK